MRVDVAFQDERIGLDVPDERLVGAWAGPAGVPAERAPGLVAEALESPHDFPPLRQAVVPGDRVVIALGPDVPEAQVLIDEVCRVLGQSGVAPGDVTVLSSAGPEVPAPSLPAGVGFALHDPDDPNGMAYLANTTAERRVYLNRLLTDADLVLPVGRLSYDRVFGYQGPWGVIYPGLSDTETRQAYQAMATDHPADRRQPRPALKEAAEVSWLLGCQLEVGVLPGVTGLTGVVAGLGTAVLEHGAGAVDAAWDFRADSRAELVVVGVGRPGVAAGLDDLATALGAAGRLVQRGGKIVVFSRVAGALGPAFRRLAEAGDPRSGLTALKGLEIYDDHAAARQVAQTLAWADVYLFSALAADDVDALSMIVLDRPEEARRLVALCGSCLVVSQADLVRAGVAGDAG